VQVHADRLEAEFVDVEFLERNPLETCNVIESLEGGTTLDAHLEEEVDGTAHDAREHVAIGLAEEIAELRGLDIHARLLLNLTTHALFGCLVEVHEATHQVAGALGWIVGTTAAEQLALVVDDHGHGSSARIGIVGEATSVAMTRIGAMLHKLVAAA